MECGSIIKRLNGKKKADTAGGSLRGGSTDNARCADRAQSEAAKAVRTGNGNHDEVLPRKAAAKEARTGNENHDEVLPKKEVTAQDSSVKEERTDNAVAEAAHPENDGVEATVRPEKVEAETAVHFDDSDLEAIPAIDRGMRHDQWTVYTVRAVLLQSVLP